MKSHKISLCVLFVLLHSLCGFALAEGRPHLGPDRTNSSLVFEFQAYRTGIIPGFTYERFFSNKDAWHLRAGFQVIRHEDFGEHDDERGNGFGGSVGYRRYWSNGLSVGGRVDLWSNELDWTDNIGEADELSLIHI